MGAARQVIDAVRVIVIVAVFTVHFIVLVVQANAWMDDKVELSMLQASDIDAARELVNEYVRSLDIDLSFQGIEGELADFPSKYAEPDGAFLVAKDGDRVVGCVGLRKLDDGICEMKRLYVLDEYKGKGIGKELISAILAEAKAKGYGRMRLDTLHEMKAARKLYSSFGFLEIEPYTFNPVEGAIFMEKDLGTVLWRGF